MHRFIVLGDDVAGDTKASEASTPKLTVESVNNHIYFYANVDSDRTLDLIKRVRELDTFLIGERLSMSLPDEFPLTPIWLHIQSDGGVLFSGFSMADQLAAINTPVYSVIEGSCASAATLISLACTRRYILPNAFMLIHQISGFMGGKYEEFKDEMNLMDMAMERLVNFYVARTNMDEDRVRELLKRDTWFDAHQALEHGLVDEILM